MVGHYSDNEPIQGKGIGLKGDIKWDRGPRRE